MEAYSSSKDLFGSEDAVSLDGLGGGDVRGEHCYYVASKNIKGKGEVVFVVRSDGMLLHVTKQEGNINHLSDGSIVRDLCVPYFRSWSDDSILKFVDGNEAVKPLSEIYNQAKTILKKMIFIDENNLSLLAIVAISSFFVSMAKATPFIHFRAPEPNTGKTHAMMSLLKICFNSSKGEETAIFGKASQSSIFRSLAQSRGVVAFDDLEVINNTKTTPLRVGMLVGYKRQSAIQTLMERGKSKQFNLFQIKFVSSINEAEPILGSRMIVVQMKRAPAGYLPSAVNESTLSNFRDDLHIAAMDGATRNLVGKLISKAETDARYTARFGEITAILRGVAEACGASLALEKALAPGEPVARVTPKLDDIVSKIFMDGFEGVTVAQVQAELTLSGFWFPPNRLGMELTKSMLLTPGRQVTIHGKRTQVYKPTKKAKSTILGKWNRDPRGWCLQAHRKHFNADRCDGCVYKQSCPVRLSKPLTK